MRVSTLVSAAAVASVETAESTIGPLLGKHGAHRMRRYMEICAAIALVIGGVSLSVAVISLHAHMYVCVGAASMVALLCSALALCVGRAIHDARDAWIEIGEEGFRLSRAGALITTRWEEVESIWEYSRYVPWRRHAIQQSYHLTLVRGRTVRIAHMFDWTKELGASLQRLTTAALLPGALAAYERGEPVCFGHFSVTQWGISNGQETLLWRDLRRIECAHGVLTIVRSDPQRPWERRLWARVPVAQMPNIYLLTALINEVPRA